MKNEIVSITNLTMELKDCRDCWTFDEKRKVWRLEDILYTDAATTPKFQRLSIFVPEAYLHPDGTINNEGKMNGLTAATAPVVFGNNSAGYMQMPHTWLDGPRCAAMKYLPYGYVYVTCGNRGSDSLDQYGHRCGKAPINLIDLKTAIRFLRHNEESIPGNFNRIISDGWSAGGAMSLLLSVTGNSHRYDELLRKNHAFMDERDDVYASLAYCPITDLDHADMAYEWMFHKDVENEDSPAGPHGFMTPFQKALSKNLKERYIAYFNGLGLKDPENGEPFVLSSDGRSGSAYTFIMDQLDDAAAKYLAKLEKGELKEQYSIDEYVTGQYETEILAPKPGKKKPDLMQGHAGPGVDLHREAFKEEMCPTLGDMMSRPSTDAPQMPFKLPMITVPGKDKRSWLSLDGGHVSIGSLDAYVCSYRRRMKPCTAFDTLGCDSGENRLFGAAEVPAVHFDEDVYHALRDLQDMYPGECSELLKEWDAVINDEKLAEQKYLINPMNFIGTNEKADQASHYRIRVGANDADTSFSVTTMLYVKLKNAGFDADYALVWEKPHSEADYEGEAADWIKSIL